MQHRQVEGVGPPVLDGVRATAGLRGRRVDRGVLALAALRRRRSRASTGQPSSALRSTPCGLVGALSWLSLIWFLPRGGVTGVAVRAVRAGGAGAPVDDLGLVDREAVVVGGGEARGVRRRRSRRRRWRRRSGTRRGGGCRRPAPRSARPTRRAGCGGPGRRRSARAARRRRPGARPRRASARTAPDHGVGVGVRVRVHGREHRQPRAGDPQRGAPQQVLELLCVRHGPSLVPFLEPVKIDAPGVSELGAVHQLTELGEAQLAHLPHGQPAELHRPDGGAGQLGHGVPDVLQ